jgi:hypothetical protein
MRTDRQLTHSWRYWLAAPLHGGVLAGLKSPNSPKLLWIEEILHRAKKI